MCKKKKNSPGQSVSEYIILISIVVAVFTGMQVYLQRGIQGLVKDAADEIGEQGKGVAEYDRDIDWIWRANATTNTTSSGAQITEGQAGGPLRYRTEEATREEGIVSHGVFQRK
jgi:hypothetical protein